MKLYSNSALLEKYSRDRSIYQIKPKYVCFPKNESDLIEIVRFAKQNKVPIIPRGGGTGLSGSAIGKGIVIDFSKYFTKIYKIGKITRVQSGILLKELRPKLEKAGYMLPSVPLHGYCAIGGNVNTRSIGHRTLKYGTMDKQVKSVRGILADGRILDTSSEKKIPNVIKENILKLRNKIKKEKALIEYLKSRPLVAGGYNLLSLINNKKTNDIITHLIVGSVGTLLLLTEVSLKLPKYKEFDDVYLIHFKDLDCFQKTLNNLIKNKVTSVEYAEKENLELWAREFRHPEAKYTMIVAFENHKDIKKIVIGALETKNIIGKKRKKLWKSRAGALPMSEKKAKEIGFDVPSGIDDTSIKPEDFSKVRLEVERYSKKSGIPISAFGHVAVGSIHLKPLIDMKNHPEKLDKVGKDIFKILRKYKGTLVGEHNSGLCRSRYLPMESKKMYLYMKKVKNIFDPENILNPRVMFNLEPITNNLGV